MNVRTEELVTYKGNIFCTYSPTPLGRTAELDSLFTMGIFETTFKKVFQDNEFQENAFFFNPDFYFTPYEFYPEFLQNFRRKHGMLASSVNFLSCQLNWKIET